jgi:hypothetical protein
MITVALIPYPDVIRDHHMANQNSTVAQSDLAQLKSKSSGVLDGKEGNLAENMSVQQGDPSGSPFFVGSSVDLFT